MWHLHSQTSGRTGSSSLQRGWQVRTSCLQCIPAFLQFCVVVHEGQMGRSAAACHHATAARSWFRHDSVSCLPMKLYCLHRRCQGPWQQQPVLSTAAVNLRQLQAAPQTFSAALQQPTPPAAAAACRALAARGQQFAIWTERRGICRHAATQSASATSGTCRCVQRPASAAAAA